MLAAAGHENQCGGDFAMGQRNLIFSCRSQSGSDARNDFNFYARLAQGFEFFSAATEDEWIAALKPHDSPSHDRVLDKQGISGFLRRALFSATLAYIQNFGVCRNQL